VTDDSSTLFASVVALMLLITPYSHIHYETTLLLPLAVLLCRQCANPGDRRGWTLLGLAWLLLAVGDETTINAIRFLSPVAQSYKFYGNVLVWAMCIAAMLGTRADGRLLAGSTMLSRGEMSRT